jgi:hypothetical protein
VHAGEVRDRVEIERWLRREAASHVYALADLDDVFWPETRWFALRSDGQIAALCLLLDKLALPILYAVAPPGDPATRALLEWLRPSLPDRVFATPAVGIADALAPAFEIHSHGEWQKMALASTARLAVPEPAEIERLGTARFDELRAFYAHDAYLPEERGGRFFERYMLEIGPWFGVREAGRLVSVAGVRVLSRARASRAWAGSPRDRTGAGAGSRAPSPPGSAASSRSRSGSWR